MTAGKQRHGVSSFGGAVACNLPFTRNLARSTLPTVNAFVEKVRATIEWHRLLSSHDRVVVAVSGGADSCALLVALMDLRAVFDFELQIAHLNHKLRAAAEEEAGFVRALAEQLGLPCTVGECEVATRARKSKQSMEAAARTARYEFLEATAEAVGAPRIAVGHTADDQVETVLLNLVRGSGLRGLAGMPIQRGRIVRPLLEVTRAETEAFCHQRAIEFRLDESNANLRFARNRIRVGAIPVLRSIVPSLATCVRRATLMVREDDELLEAIAQRELDDMCSRWSGGAVIDLEYFRRHPRALQRRMLRLALERAQGHRREVEFAHVEAVLEALAGGQTRGGWTIPGGTRIVIAGDTVVITPAASPAVAWPARPLPVPGFVELPELGQRLEVSLLRRSELPCDKLTDVRVAYVEAKGLGDLIVRPPRARDRFQPLGMAGTKKLSDFFRDAKLPRALWARVPVVETTTGLVWVAGWRIDERWKVTETTESVVRLRLANPEAPRPVPGAEVTENCNGSPDRCSCCP